VVFLTHLILSVLYFLATTHWNFILYLIFKSFKEPRNRYPSLAGPVPLFAVPARQATYIPGLLKRLAIRAQDAAGPRFEPEAN